MINIGEVQKVKKNIKWLQFRVSQILVPRIRESARIHIVMANEL
jgi:hypothetical protein